MVMLNDCVEDPITFVAVTLPLKVPAVVGVPLTAPPLANDSPGGNPPEVTLKTGTGEPVAAYVCEYAELTVPAPGGLLVIAGATPGVTLTVPEAALVPLALVAVTEHAYVVPFESPPTVTGEPAPPAEIDPGLHVAV
jgi:hypothetical protein